MEDKGGYHFTSNKSSVLAKADLSRKGSVDEPIRDLIGFINAQECYYTTSSCSGRLSIYSEDNERQKKGCQWLLVSHDQIDLSQLVSSLTAPEDCDFSQLPQNYSFFKFEPFILHVVCKTMTDAQTMLQVAVGSGFRNSGITCGRKGKIMLAVRSTLSLEVPLTCERQLLVSQTYLEHLVKLGNGKLRENNERTNRFYSNLKHAFELQATKKKNSEATRESENLPHKAQCHRNESTSPPSSASHQHHAPVMEEDLTLGELFIQNT